jgi:5-methylcytosine-specific restriction endonuclease McrA
MSIETMPCPKCGQESPFQSRPDTQHHGGIRCPTHGHMWIPKPTELKTVRRKVNRDLFELAPKDMRDFCWTCLRDRDLLKTIRPCVSLQAHHIFEVKHGGIDHRDNIQILCDECHAAVHTTRRQLHRYNSISNLQASAKHNRLTALTNDQP